MKSIFFKSVIGIFLLMLMAACGHHAEKQKELQANQAKHFQAEVMAIHDEVMPKWTHMVTLEEKLSAYEEETVPELIKNLRIGYDGMQDWMMDWSKNSTKRETATHKELITYLEGEKVRITKVKEDMLSSIEKAEAFLESKK